jgi:hypothetical protein
MPTIDQLAPATSASDTDELIASQGGITRKITRSQILNGYQEAILLSPQTLVGRASSGVGAAEVISIGQNLILDGGTLTASASPFNVGQLQPGQVPHTGDLLPLFQGGSNVSVSFGDFVSGISQLSNVDLSNGLVTPAGLPTAQTLSAFSSSVLLKSGGSLSGALVLAADPTVSRHAATKSYVDQAASQSLALSGGSMAGALSLAAMPTLSLHAASKAYVDTATSGFLPWAGGSLTGVLYLKGDPTSALQASTRSYTDQKVARGGDTMVGTLVLASDPTAPFQAATKSYVDGQMTTAVAKSGGTLTGNLILASDPSSAAQAATKQYVDQRLLRAGDTLTGPLSLSADPTVANQAATKNYVDAQAASAVMKAGASMSGALLLASDPSAPLQASTRQYVDLRVARSGDSLTGLLSLATDPTAPLNAATKQYVDARVGSGLTAAGGSFTGPVALAADPVAALQATTKQYTDKRVLRTGDTMTGVLVLAADPTVSAGAATKNYVDTSLLTMMPLNGGSFAGGLLLAGDPVASLQAATKRYVDGQVLTSLPAAGGTVTGILSLATAPNLPAHATNKQYVDAQLATALLLQGGSLKGPLLLSSAPTLPLHAATKQYVDANPGPTGVINVTLPPYGAALNGTTDDTAAFKSAYQAASPGSAIYVPFGITKLQQPGSWGIALTKRVKWLVDGTTLPDGTPLASAVPTGGATANLMLPGLVVGNTSSGFSVSQSGSAASDLAVNQSSYIVSHNGGTSTVVTNQRVDTMIFSSPANFVWGGLDRLLWAGTQTPTGLIPAQHVARYIQTLRGAAVPGANGSYLPQPEMWCACLEYRDMTGLPSSSTAASLTVEMDWYGNGADDANSRQIQSLVIGQANTAGLPVEVSSAIGVYLAGGSAGSVKNVFSIGVPFSGAVFDTRAATSISSAPVLKMAAGQAIAFEGTGTNKLWFDGTFGALRWSNGLYNNVLGRGITVGFQSVFGSSAAVPAYQAGNICFLVGSAPITMTLPLASTVPAGVGFTFSNLGSATAGIVASGGNAIDCSPIVLQPNERYHVISDGSSAWREIFRTNAWAPKWQAPPVLPSYTVATLPTGISAGGMAFASNGRKPSEGTGAGTGVQVYFDGSRWISSSTGTAVAS